MKLIWHCTYSSRNFIFIFLSLFRLITYKARVTCFGPVRLYMKLFCLYTMFIYWLVPRSAFINSYWGMERNHIFYFLLGIIAHPWMPLRGRRFNSSPPSAAYMRQWIGSALNQIMPFRRQAIIWTNAELLSIGPLGTFRNFNEIRIRIQNLPFMKMHLKTSSTK